MSAIAARRETRRTPPSAVDGFRDALLAARAGLRTVSEDLAAARWHAVRVLEAHDQGRAVPVELRATIERWR